MTLSSSRGIALVTVLLVSSLVFTMAPRPVAGGLGESAGRAQSRRGGRARGRRPCRYGARGPRAGGCGLERRAHGAGAGERIGWRARPGLAWSPAARTLDLSVQTNLLNCASAAGCSDGEMQGVTADRPWGANNPRWRLFLFGPLGSLVPLHSSPAIYLLVWVGDDGREADGAPEADGGSPTEEGRDVLRVHAAAFGRDGGRRAVEAELVRVCRPPEAGPPCLPGIRVQSWRDLRHVASLISRALRRTDHGHEVSRTARRRVAGFNCGWVQAQSLADVAKSRRGPA